MVDCDGWAHPRNRGHPTDLFLGENVIGIDTGCGMGGFLTGVELPEMHVYESRWPGTLFSPGNLGIIPNECGVRIAGRQERKRRGSALSVASHSCRIRSLEPSLAEGSNVTSR